MTLTWNPDYEQQPPHPPTRMGPEAEAEYDYRRRKRQREIDQANAHNTRDVSKEAARDAVIRQNVAALYEKPIADACEQSYFAVQWREARAAEGIERTWKRLLLFALVVTILAGWWQIHRLEAENTALTTRVQNMLRNAVSVEAYPK